MKRVIHFFLVLLLLNSVVFSQPSSSDSIQFQEYSDLGSSFFRSNPDSCILYGRLMLYMGEVYESLSWQSKAYNMMGNACFMSSSYDSAITNYNAAYQIGLKNKDSLVIAAMLNNVGMVYHHEAQYDTAIEILLKAKWLRESIEDPKLSSTLNNLGNVYLALQDYKVALPYYKQSADLKRLHGQKKSLSTTLNNIGIVLKNLGKYTEAIKYYKDALQLAEEFGDKYKEANTHNNLAILYEKDLDTYGLSEYHYKEAIRIKKESSNWAGLFNSYSNYSVLLSKMGDEEATVKYIRLADELEERLGENLYSSGVLRQNAASLSNLGQYDLAYAKMLKAFEIHIKEQNEDRNEKIAAWQTKFETAEKEAEIEKLALSNELKTANLERSRNANYAMAIGAFSLIVLIIVYFALRHKRQKLDQEAQELRIDALQKRLLDLNATPPDLHLEITVLNSKLQSPLSEREFDTLRLSVDGKSNAEIADELFISISTVKFHLTNTYSKLGVSNRKEALDYVVKKN